MRDFASGRSNTTRILLPQRSSASSWRIPAVRPHGQHSARKIGGTRLPGVKVIQAAIGIPLIGVIIGNLKALIVGANLDVPHGILRRGLRITMLAIIDGRPSAPANSPQEKRVDPWSP